MKRVKNVLIIVAALILISAKSHDLLQQAKTYKAQKKYSLAIEMYENALAESAREGDNSATKESTRELAIIHYQLKNYIKSEWYFDQIVNNPDCDVDVLFKYARLQQINGRTEKAIEFYNKWAEKMGNASLATPYTNYCELIKKGEGKDNTTAVNSMGFNTKAYDEYSAVVNNGKLIFTSNKPGKTVEPKDNYGQYFTDLVQSNNLDYRGDKSTSLFSKSLKTIYNESTASFTRDGNTVYFTGNNLKKSKESPNYSLGIYTSEFDGYKWSKPKLLDFVTPGYNYAFPTISADGMSLYFSSDILNGAGGMDIYRSIFDSGKWGTPSNLGDNVNSTDNEVYPYLFENANKATLYFSTDGKPGYGGLDIFSTSITAGMPTNPAEILLAPINSAYDDFGYWASNSNTFGYISSNRDGSDDVFYFKKSDQVISTEAEPQVVYIEKKEETRKTQPTKEVVKEDKKVIVPIEEEPEIAKEETKPKMEEKEEPEIVKEETKPEENEEKKIVTKEPEPEKEVAPVKKPEPKKVVTPKPATPKASTAGVIEYSAVAGYYMIVYTAYNLYNLTKYRDANHKEANIIHSENDFYLIAYPLPGDADEAHKKFEEMKVKHKNAWFYFPKN